MKASAPILVRHREKARDLVEPFAQALADEYAAGMEEAAALTHAHIARSAVDREQAVSNSNWRDAETHDTARLAALAIWDDIQAAIRAATRAHVPSLVHPPNAQ